MNWWTIAIYVIASALAVNGLFALMIAHRRVSLQQQFEDLSRRNAAPPRQSPEPPPTDAGRKSKAA